MTRKEFDEWLRKAKENNETEPFCPFNFFGYCNIAYSEDCWTCPYREENKDERG